MSDQDSSWATGDDPTVTAESPSARRPRVLLLSPLPPPYGGIAHWTTMVRDWTAESGAVDLVVVDTAPKSRGILEASRAARLAQGVVRLPRELGLLLRSVRRQRPDVIHLNTSGQFALVRDIAIARVCHVLRIPFIYHIRFGRLPVAKAGNTWEWRLFSRAARRASVVIALDERTQEAVLGLGHPRVHRIPNFVDLDGSAPLEATTRQPVCLFVGWIIESKGVLELIHAWKALDPAGWELKLVGPVDESFSARLQEEGVPDSVTMTGSLDHTEVVKLMRSSGLFVFPSHTEGFPNAVAEAMAADLPILASGVGAIPEMLADGAGVVVPPRDEEALRHQLGSLLADDARRSSLAVRAGSRVRENYAKEVVMQRYLSEWTRLANAARKGA